MIGAHERQQLVPIGVAFDRMQCGRRAASGDVAVQRHLNRDRPFPVVVEGETGEKGVGRKAIGVDDTPGRVGEMFVHRAEHAVDLVVALRGHRVGVVRIPDVGTRRVGDDVAMRLRDLGIPQPPLPTVGLGDRKGQVGRRHRRSLGLRIACA